MRHLAPITLQNRLGITKKTTRFDFLLRDRFLTPDAAPLTSPRICEPGPGSFVIVDSGNRLSIQDGKLTTKGLQQLADPLMYCPTPFTRVPGLAFMVSHTVISIPATATRVRYQFHDNNGIGVNSNLLSWLFYHSANDLYTAATRPGKDVADLVTHTEPLQSNTTYTVAIVVAEVGAYYFFRRGEGEWLITPKARFGSVSPLYFNKSAQGVSANITALTNFMVVADLSANGFGGLWETEEGPFLQQLQGEWEEGQILIHPARFVIELELVPPTSNSATIHFRQLDEDNYYEIEFSPSEDRCRINKITAGVSSEETWFSLGSQNPIKISLVSDESQIQVAFNNRIDAGVYSTGSIWDAINGHLGNSQIGSSGGDGIFQNVIIRNRVVEGSALQSLQAMENASEF